METIVFIFIVLIYIRRSFLFFLSLFGTPYFFIFFIPLVRLFHPSFYFIFIFFCAFKKVLKIKNIHIELEYVFFVKCSGKKVDFRLIWYIIHVGRKQELESNELNWHRNEWNKISPSWSIENLNLLSFQLLSWKYFSSKW